MNKLKAFQNSNVLITGHTGFKGSWLSLILLELKAKVTGISKGIPTIPSNFVASKLESQIKHLVQDITDTARLTKVIQETQPDFIFHLAAQPLVRHSINEPVETWNANALGTISLLESVKTLKKDCIIICITSDKVYKNQEWAWGYRETDVLGGYDPYSASKAAAELAISSYAHTFFYDNNIKIGIGRAGNVIGGGDWSVDRIVPDCIKSWIQNKNVDIRNPHSTRPWQHVLEPLFGYLTLALKLKKDRKFHGEAFNFGPIDRNNHTVSELVIEMSKYWKNLYWKDVSVDQVKKNESKLLKLNCDKAKLDLGWESIWDFETTVKHTSKWYRSFYELENSLDLSVEQINLYIEQAINKKK